MSQRLCVGRLFPSQITCVGNRPLLRVGPLVIVRRYDYRTNVAAYPAWQAWLRRHQPPTLVVWGRYDSSFITPGAEAYKHDLPNAEVHVLDAGHFALDEKADEIAALMLGFLNRHPG